MPSKADKDEDMPMDLKLNPEGGSLITGSVDMHYGFPRMVRSQSGDLLLFYRVGTTHAYDDASIGMRRSSDNGKSWSDERILWQCEPGFSAHNPVSIVNAQGRIILWASRFEHGPRLRHPCWWSSSDDHGHTWSTWTMFDPSAHHSCYYVTDAVHTSEGLLAIDATFPVTAEGSCHTRVHFSSDDGVSWACRSNLTSPKDNLGDEAALLETEEDALLCIQRDRIRSDSFRYWSRDGGHTWGERESIRDMLGCVLQRPFLTRLDEKFYLLSGRDFDRKRVVAYLSMDGGQTFGHRLELDIYQKDGGYTTAVRLDRGACLIAWYSDSHTHPLKPDIKTANLTVRLR